MLALRVRLRVFNNLWLLLLALTSFILGLVLVYFTGVNQNNFGDAPDYLSAALTISNQEPYLREDLAWPFFRAPGYPFVISTIWTLTGIQEVWILKVFNVLCHSISTLFVFKLASLALSQKRSFVVALIYAINPFALLQLAGVQTEPLITALFLAFTYLLCQNVSKLNIVLLSVISVFAIATRPEYLFMILPTIILSFFLRSFPRDSRHRAVVVFAAIFISLAWWGMQNEKATDAFLPLTDATNFQLWQGSTSVIQQNYPWHTSTYPEFNDDQMEKLVTEVKNQEMRWGERYSSASIAQKSEFWKSAYLENVKENPLRYIEYTLLKAVVFWRPFLNPASYGAVVSIGSSIILAPLSLFMVLGLIRYRKQENVQTLIFTFGVGFISLTLIHAVQVADLRYKIPLFIPFATLMAGKIVADYSPKLQGLRTKFTLRRTVHE
jgi:hypothetical protein